MQNTQFLTAANPAPIPPASTDDLIRESAFLAYKLALAEKRVAEQERKIRELESLASTDSLTGLMNRRSFEAFFAQELARTRRNNAKGATLLLLDLDKFKGINDTHGHPAGDACLKAVANYLKNRLRSTDGAARLGGDEFAILLSNGTPAKVVEEIKDALSNMQAEWNGQKMSFGVSVGVHNVAPEGTYEKAYLAADKDLYAHKENKKRFF